jgi:hypothetical protein
MKGKANADPSLQPQPGMAAQAVFTWKNVLFNFVIITFSVSNLPLNPFEQRQTLVSGIAAAAYPARPRAIEAAV